MGKWARRQRAKASLYMCSGNRRCAVAALHFGDGIAWRRDTVLIMRQIYQVSGSLRCLRTKQKRFPWEMSSGDFKISSHLLPKSHRQRRKPQCKGPPHAIFEVYRAAAWARPGTSPPDPLTTSHQSIAPAHGISVDHPRDPVRASHSRRALSKPLTTHHQNFELQSCRHTNQPAQRSRDSPRASTSWASFQPIFETWERG